MKYIVLLCLVSGISWGKTVESLKFQDQVVKIEKRPDGHGIHFKNQAALYKVRPNQKEILQSLRSSLNKKSAVSIESDPYSMNIQRVKPK